MRFVSIAAKRNSDEQKKLASAESRAIPAPAQAPPLPDNRWRQLSVLNPDSRQPTETRQVHWEINFDYVLTEGRRWKGVQ